MSSSSAAAVSDSVSVSLSLIHDFELRCGADLIPMSPSSQRLVGFVALHDRPVRRGKVSGMLWLDSSEDRASASLRSALWRIPAPRGIRVLVASDTHLWLNPCVEVDFHAITARARAVLDGGSDNLTVIDAARELCCFNDDLLPGWYDDWVIMERERFHQLRLQALDHLGECLRACGRLGDAILVGLAAVQAEPLRETAHRLVIRVHLEQGNVAEAVRQYTMYEYLLADEIGAVPSMAMRTLIEPCLSHAPGRRVPRDARISR